MITSICLNETSTCGINRGTASAELIKRTKLFVWDEAPMMSRYVYETVDRTFRDIMKTVDPKLEHVPFGGKLMIFSGDFRQMLPVVRHGNSESIISQCINKSYFWKQVKCLGLKMNMRVNQLDELNAVKQRQFAKYLLRIGDGKEPIVSSTNVIELPPDICLENNKIDELVEWVYNDFENNYCNSDYLIKRAILCTTNKTVDSINKQILNKIPGNKTILYSTNTPVDEGQAALYPVEFLNEFEVAGLPPHELHLKPNAIVMLMRNLNLAKGLCNGTRLMVKTIKQYVIEAKVLSGPQKEQTIFIPRISLYPDEEESPFIFKRRQFPIKLAFSVTINKSQGQTIQKCGVYIDTPLFNHGHLYTAMSRVCNRESLKILVEKTMINYKLGFYVNNIVYYSVLNFKDTSKL